MLKLSIVSAVVLVMTQFASADQIKTGKVFFNGAEHTVRVDINGLDSGSVFLDQTEYDIYVSGHVEIDAKLQNMQLEINFTKLPEADIKKMLSNSDEVNCDNTTNALVALYDTQTGVVVGNCAEIQ
jgi:hypothetical protein